MKPIEQLEAEYRIAKQQLALANQMLALAYAKARYESTIQTESSANQS